MAAYRQNYSTSNKNISLNHFYSFYIYRRSTKFNFNSKAILDIKTFLFSFLFGYSLTRILYNPIILHQWSFIGYKQTSFFSKCCVRVSYSERNFKIKNGMYYSFCSTIKEKIFWALLSIYFSVEWVNSAFPIFSH